MQTSESFLLSALLSFSGGLQDAYTYNIRDQVFANAQTGNVVLMSQCFMTGEWRQGLRFMLPLLSFAIGIFVTERIEHRFKEVTAFHWRQLILLVEIVALAIVGFMPLSANMAANIIVSFACAMQVQAFRTVGGHTYASTMCIGNLRSGTEALTLWIHTKQRKYGSLVLHYFGVIAAFALGAGIGGVLSRQWGQRTIWLSCGILLIAFALMEFDRIPKEKA